MVLLRYLGPGTVGCSLLIIDIKLESVWRVSGLAGDAFIISLTKGQRVVEGEKKRREKECHALAEAKVTEVKLG